MKLYLEFSWTNIDFEKNEIILQEKKGKILSPNAS